jgi:hypothetical protein
MGLLATVHRGTSLHTAPDALLRHAPQRSYLLRTGQWIGRKSLRGRLFA